MNEMYAQAWIVNGERNRISFLPIDDLRNLPAGWSIKELYRNTILTKNDDGLMVQADSDDAARARVVGPFDEMLSAARGNFSRNKRLSLSVGAIGAETLTWP